MEKEQLILSILEIMKDMTDEEKQRVIDYAEILQKQRKS